MMIKPFFSSWNEFLAIFKEAKINTPRTNFQSRIQKNLRAKNVPLKMFQTLGKIKAHNSTDKITHQIGQHIIKHCLHG